MGRGAGWFVWLDLVGYHARRAGEPKGIPPRVSAATRDGAVAAIHTAQKTPLPQRVPWSPPGGWRAARWEVPVLETLTRVQAALRRL